MEYRGSACQIVASLVNESLKTTFPNLEGLEPLVVPCNNANFGDYQCNNAMSIWSRIKGSGTEFRNPSAVGQAIMNNIPPSNIIERSSIAGPGFVNIVLSKEWLEKRLMQLLVDGVQSWHPVLNYSRVLIDFSSPNIAKEMHVGHLRSTIIGDSLARMLEYCQVDVLRRNHVGDWGTQFGMLIEHLFDQFPDWETVGEQAVGDLQTFYKAAKVRFDAEPEFKERAQKAVVRLQGGEAVYRAAWTKICDVSRKEFAAVYERLGVKLEEKGESFYNPYISSVVQELESKGLVEDSQGARCIFLPSKQKVKKESKKKAGKEGSAAPAAPAAPAGAGAVQEAAQVDRGLPLILVKSDGGFNYATTDMACLWYRINEEKAEWIIYVTDAGQADHFSMFFEAAELAGWLPSKAALKAAASFGQQSEKKAVKVSHVPFGLVLGTDGKRFRTRSSEVVRLVDLLEEAVARSREGLIERGKEGWSEEDISSAAVALGFGAVKYADLKNNRLTNYTFDYDQMLDMRGNTAVYLMYAYARICSIIRKSGKEIDSVIKSGAALKLSHESERALAVDLVRFPEIVQQSLADLLPNTLCEYLYNLSGSFTTFYTNCQVVGSEEESSRLLLCAATATVMGKSFYLLGITPLERL